MDRSIARAARPSFVESPVAPARAVPYVIAFVIVSLGLTLLAIGARSPYTHANLSARFDPDYTRTEQIPIAPAAAYAGLAPAGTASGDPVAQGLRLFVTMGCATCHGLDALGGVVGPAIAGVDLRAVLGRTRQPMGGMPRYSAETLTDDQATAIAAYLRTLSPPGKP
jgi:mono/diheme cytochrome c family protein